MKDKIKFSYGLYFLGKAVEETGKDLAQILLDIQNNPHSELVDLMYLSYKVNCKLDEVKPDVSKRQFVEYIERSKDLSNDDGLAANFLNKLTETMNEFLPKSDEEVETAKKK